MTAEEKEIKKWEGDKLDRKKDADFLTAYITKKYKTQNEDESFVLNVNAEWGFGKTFFLKKWKKDLVSDEDSKHPVVYYDAWKNDYTKSPLTSFLYEFQKQISEDYINDIDGIGKVVKSLLKTGLQCASLFVDPSGTLVKTSDKTLESFIEKHEETKKEIEGFSEKINDIGKYFENRGDMSLPIYVIIDELDRCRPTFSIELLEVVKHLFCSKYISFVVATDSRQLEKSIKVIYGSGFDSGKYLNRFFDHEYSLEKPNNKKFSEYIFSKYDLSSELYFSPMNSLPETFEKLSDYFKTPLREQLHAASLLEAVSLSEQQMQDINIQDVDFFYMLFLILLKLKKSTLFDSYITSSSGDRFLQNNLFNSTDFNNDIDISSFEMGSDGFSVSRNGSTQIQISDVIRRYDLEQNKDIRGSEDHPDNETVEIYHKIATRLYKQKRIIANTKKPTYFDLVRYFGIVKQVGQLSY